VNRERVDKLLKPFRVLANNDSCNFGLTINNK
jgi:hypothetical protein